MVDAARRASAARITAVIPFFGYARQDRKDQPRVPITAKLVANLLDAAGVDRVLTMDLHAQQVAGFFDIPVDHLFAAPVVIRHLRNMKIENPVVVSPDVGGLKMASAYSQALNASLAIVAKRRKSATEIEALNVIGEVEGRGVILVDDLTETAGTLCAAAKMLKDHGAKEIIACTSHAVLSLTSPSIGSKTPSSPNSSPPIASPSAPRTAFRSPRSASRNCWAKASSGFTTTNPSLPCSASARPKTSKVL